MIRYGERTVLEVETGILLIGIFCCAAVGTIWGFGSPECLGFEIGMAGAMVLFYSMGLSAETSLDLMDPAAARKHSSRMQGIRYLAIILGAFLMSRWSRRATAAGLAALLLIKPALYLQPFIHSRFCLMFGWKDELSPDALILPEDEEDEEDEEPPDGLERWLERKYKK